LTVDVGDINTPNVRVLQPSGSADLAEFNPAFGVSAASLSAAGFPLQNSYQVVLTKPPAAGETITVNALANPTRTDRGGGINGLRSFTQMVQVSVDGVSFSNIVPLTFNSTNWDIPQTVYVKAIPNDGRVEGNDTTVFAPMLHQASAIRGPLIIHGGSSGDRTGLTELPPVMLPYEKDVKQSVGSVVSATEAAGVVPATVTIHPSDLTSLTSAQLAKLGITIANPA